MANYSYSTPYTGQQVPTLPPGYMEAATAPGRNLAMGIASMGQNIGKAIEQYRTKKADTESATQSWETVSGLMQQQLASDPKYLAIQQYMDSGALPQGVTEKDIPQFTQKVMADREMLNKFSSLGEKFPDMSLAKKKAALGDAVMVLNQYRTDQSNEVRDAAARQQLAAGALQLSQAQKQAEAAPFLTKAMLDIASRKPGQGPGVPYANVTEEMIGKYGNKLTPEMRPSFIQQIQRMNQTLPAGIVPTGATVGPEGTKVEYGLPATPTAIPVAGAPGYFQTMVGGKAVGDIKQIYPQVQAKINELPEQQQKWANEKQTELSKDKSLMVLNEQVKAVEEMRSIPKNPSGDIALIIKYMKTLDPGSIVSPTELRTIGNAGSLPTQIQNWYNSYATGDKLTPEVRVQIMEAAESVLRGGIKAIQPTIEDAISAGKYRGVPEEAILPLNTIKRWREVSQQSQAQTMQRFQSPADMKAAGVTRGLVFNPANGKYSEYIQD